MKGCISQPPSYPHKTSALKGLTSINLSRSSEFYMIRSAGGSIHVEQTRRQFFPPTVFERSNVVNREPITRRGSRRRCFAIESTSGLKSNTNSSRCSPRGLRKSRNKGKAAFLLPRAVTVVHGLKD